MILLAFINEGNPVIDFPHGRKFRRNSIEYICKLRIPVFTSFLEIDSTLLFIMSILPSSVHDLDPFFLPPLKGRIFLA